MFVQLNERVLLNLSKITRTKIDQKDLKQLKMLINGFLNY